MNELIAVTNRNLDGISVPTCNARDLWQFVESKQHFADWIKNRIEQYGFVQDVDFAVINNFMKDDTAFGGNRKIKDYHLTLEMAKELAMVENNDKGREVRRYFIECERQAKAKAKPPAAPRLPKLNPYREFKGYHSVAKLLGLQGNHAAIAANNAVIKLTGVNVLQLIEHEHLPAAVQEPLLTPTEMAQRLGVGIKKVNPLLIEAGLQTSTRDHKGDLRYEITDKGKPYGVYLDTGKKHGDGTPVRQIKWYATVLNVLNHHPTQQEAA